MIYLDTHVVIWLYTGKVAKLSKRAYETLDEGELWISPLVRLELQYLFEVKKLSKKPTLLLSLLSKTLGLEESKVEMSEVVKVAEQLSWTRDPFDRLIVAEAMLHDAPLVTADVNIRKHFKMALW